MKIKYSESRETIIFKLTVKNVDRNPQLNTILETRQTQDKGQKKFCLHYDDYNINHNDNSV